MKSKSIILDNALTFLSRRFREISFLTFLLFFSLHSNNVLSQLTVSYVSADQAVQALLGPSISYSNAIFSGVSQQLGQMSGNTDSNIQITNGIVLGSSDAREIVPNFVGSPITPNIGGFALLSGGTGYTTGNNISVAGGNGTGMSVNITATAGIITSIYIASVGIGYMNDDIVTINQAGSGLNSQLILTEMDLLYVANSVPPLIGQSNSTTGLPNFTVSSVNNIATLEFDFVSQGNSLSFNYIFGSDEYLTWVNTQYNDVFAFFLSGPGIIGSYSSPSAFPGGAVNIAIIPESTPPIPITISSVNNVLNSTYFIDNTQNMIPINLNGFTLKIGAQYDLICGETYHIRLAIANGSDQALKSSVIIESGSFNLNNSVEMFFVDADNDGYAGDSVVYTCNQLSNYYSISTDCNDSNPTIHPGSVEVFYNSIDENCDGIIACEVAITNQPNDVFAPLGGVANFTISVPLNTAGITYQWQTLFNGQWINLFNAGQYAGASTSSLVVNNLNQSNYGKWFRCYLTSSLNSFCPTISDSVTIYGCDYFQQDFEITTSQDTVCYGGTTLLEIPNFSSNGVFLNNNIQYISDNQTMCQSFNLNVSNYLDPILTNLEQINSLHINFEHSFMGDLVITLICPNGQSMVTHQQGGSGTFLGEPIDIMGLSDPPGIGYSYSWTPTSSNGTWASNAGGTLPSGVYTSVQPFSNLIGCPINGTWTIEFCDMWDSDDGWLFNWGINFNSVTTAATDSISWQGNTLNWEDGNGTANFSPSQYGPNEYSVLATLSNGCVLSDTISIEAVGPNTVTDSIVNTCSLPITLSATANGIIVSDDWLPGYYPTVMDTTVTLNPIIISQPSFNYYDLYVTAYINGLYCMDSAHVEVNFVDASILVQPVSVEANLGEIVYFNCVASAGVSYQWQILVNGVWTNLFNAGQFSGVNTSQLSVSNVNLNNVNQQFQCVINSPDGGCSDMSNIVTINFCDIASSNIPSVLNVSLNSSPIIAITPITNGATYQWRSNIGFGWMNISDGANYVGTSTPNLQILTADWQNENEWLQCIVTTNLCSDTTNICVVHITPTGVDENDLGSIYYFDNAIHFSKISSAMCQRYYVFDGSGKLVSEGIYFGHNRIELDLQAVGVYCFKLGDEILKFIKI
ncbi:MAG: hypothetical protein RLZZ71_2277 [Bacteroidota bacterium]